MKTGSVLKKRFIVPETAKKQYAAAAVMPVQRLSAATSSQGTFCCYADATGGFVVASAVVENAFVESAVVKFSMPGTIHCGATQS